METVVILNILFFGFFILACGMGLNYWLARDYRNWDTPLKNKVYMKKISFSVELNKFYRNNTYGLGSGQECMLCHKRAHDVKTMITHLTHDHLDKDFAEIKKIDYLPSSFKDD